LEKLKCLARLVISACWEAYQVSQKNFCNDWGVAKWFLRHQFAAN
jgi:hypothetical protein